MNGTHIQNGVKSPEKPAVHAEEVLSVDQASSIAEIQATLAKLKERDSKVTSRLNELVSSQNDLSRELGKLDLVRAQLGTQAVATRSISNNMLSDAASTAKRISSAVQRLDLEQSRVRSTLDVVEQVAELKACVHGVVGSMGAPQDWETAAGYLHRASKIPSEIVKGAFAEEIVPSIEVPDFPSVTLENASESLCGLFLREFEKAAKEDNGPKVTRFFKLFPLIGRSDVGLDVYGRYVCQGVASHARANLNAGTGGAQRKEGFFYANALTKLFEYVAQIVDRHGGLVERHYGEGRMVKVIERLQVESDLQGGIVIDTWSDERNMERKLTDIRSYAFTFLVQSFLSAPASRNNPTSRSNSPAVRDRNGTQEHQEDDGQDMKDVDGCLSEISIMLGRWSLYCRFLATKCTDAKSLEDPNSVLQLPPLLTNSTLLRKVSDRLITPFNQMTTFYFRRSVEKAFQLDEAPSNLSLNLNKPIASNPPHISSAVDDVMYIVNQVITRTLSTSQRDVIAAVLPTITRVLGGDFVGMIQRKMRDESYPKPTVQGGLPPEHTIVAFLVLANNLDIATAYLTRIVHTKLELSPSSSSSSTTTTTAAAVAPPPSSYSATTNPPPRALRDAFPFGHDAVFVANQLLAVSSAFGAKTGELLGEAIQLVQKNIMRPRLRPVLADAFRDVDYTLTEAQLEEARREAEGEAEGDGGMMGGGDGDGGGGGGMSAAVADAVVVRRFQAGWEALSRPVARVLTEGNWERLLTIVVAYLAEVLEKRVWSFYGKINALGAVRLERDIAGLVGVIVRGARYGLRDNFARCMQICLVMNMEEEEWEEMVEGEGDDGIDWKISKEERERAKGMVRE